MSELPREFPNDQRLSILQNQKFQENLKTEHSFSLVSFLPSKNKNMAQNQGNRIQSALSFPSKPYFTSFRKLVSTYFFPSSLGLEPLESNISAFFSTPKAFLADKLGIQSDGDLKISCFKKYTFGLHIRVHFSLTINYVSL